jgi:repressor LexA
MENGWRKRLRELVDETPGLNMKALSRKAGLGDTYVADVLSRGFKPTVENFLAIAEAAGVSPAWLLSGEDQASLKIPLIGIVSADEKWVPADSKAKSLIDVNIRDFDLVGLEVRGNAMSPVYRDQDFLICQRRAGSFLQNLVGLDCIVYTTRNERHLKILQKGSRPNLFNLRSYNPTVEDIENVALQWAAPVIWIRRGGV